MAGEFDVRQALPNSGRTGRTAVERATPPYPEFAGIVSRGLASEPGVDSLGARHVGADAPDRAALRRGNRSGHARGDPAAKRLSREALRLIAKPDGTTSLASLLRGVLIPPPGACVDPRACGVHTNPREIVP